MGKFVYPWANYFLDVGVLDTENHRRIASHKNEFNRLLRAMANLDHFVDADEMVLDIGPAIETC